jgi:hypothetical protein
MTAPTKPDSEEHNFSPDRNPAEAENSDMGDAASYGIYGYNDRSNEGAARTSDGTPDPLIEEEAPPPGIGRSEGGQNRRESAHGAGFAQPMEEPQRHASRSPLPGKKV